MPAEVSIGTCTLGADWKKKYMLTMKKIAVDHFAWRDAKCYMQFEILWFHGQKEIPFTGHFCI